MAKWTEKNIPSQNGKIAVVTGGSDGVGFRTALELARKGARVIIASDREGKGHKAVTQIHDQIPQAQVEFRHLDTADLDSVQKFAEDLLSSIPKVDILINNAGVAGVEKRKTSPQGFEWHLAANYLGHFSLTARLFPAILKSQNARIVNVSSIAHVKAKIHFDDLQLEHDYSAQQAYGQSKLAMLLFARELDQRLRSRNARVEVFPVHPGGSKTNLFNHGRELSAEPIRSLWDIFTPLAISIFGQSAPQGALPLLYAATEPKAQRGIYYGPDGFREIRGFPAPASVRGEGSHLEIGERLWRVSESLTGVQFELAPVQKETYSPTFERELLPT
jgi:NAD(P)-dependent dehydrogenase (short-subunit alcohol dehydrogenase family)